MEAGGFVIVKTNKFQPEIGQLIYGNRWDSFDCPWYVEAALRYLESVIERVEQNITQKKFISPLDNNATRYKTPVFELRSYSWVECICPEGKVNPKCLSCLPNFKCGPLEIRWYKYCGRGMSMNKKLNANEIAKVFKKCIDYMHKKDKKHFNELIKRI